MVKQRSVSKSHWPCDHGRLSSDKTLALWLGNGDEHHPLESNTTGQNCQGEPLQKFGILGQGSALAVDASSEDGALL